MFKVKIPARDVSVGESFMIGGIKHTVLSSSYLKPFNATVFTLMPKTKNDPAQTVDLYVPQDQKIKLCWFK